MLRNYPEELYSTERIKSAFLIIHPKILERYNITNDQFYGVFETGSNFSHLKHPIYDEFGNIYEDSEGYYMAQRFTCLDIKERISKASKIKGRSKKEAYKFSEYMNCNSDDRIRFMRNAIQKKFDNSPRRQKQLQATGKREIIEYTYWGDTFFGIDNTTRKGRNILGKIIVEYRERLQNGN